MPVSSAASRYGGLSSTYSTSYGSSTASIPRPSSGRTSYLDSGYNPGSYRSTRPLPPGPGPLDSTGRNKLTSYTSGTSSLTAGRRNRTPNGIGSLSGLSTHTGPLRADHTSSFAATSNRYHTESRYGTTTSTATRPPAHRSTITNSHFGGEDVSPAARPVSGTSRSRPSKSNSLVDLSDLRISSATSRNNRGSSVSHDRGSYSPGGQYSSSSSSRNSNYRDTNNNEDIFGLNSTAIDRDRPDGTSRTGYTPSVSREGSPKTRRMIVSGESRDSRDRDSPVKSTTGHMSNGKYSSCMCGSPSTSSHVSRYRDGGKVGLKNLGNTCFMNSVLQCLSNLRLLTEYCLDDQYTRDINTTTSNMKGALIKAYASLMQSLWKEKTDSVAPNAFKTQIQKFASRFMGYAQQDSQEFLRYLLEGLHEDVNRVTKKPAPIILDDAVLDKKNDSGKAQDYWKAYVNRDNSLIVDIFVGQLKSELKFNCKCRSVTFDPFWDLSLPIPKSGRNVSLDDCLRLFMKEEELEADERPTCSKCKERRSCTKSFSIQKFPQILVIHLKRFSQERYGRKLTSVVDFPIKHLDLSEYSGEGTQGSGGRRPLYDLFAVSNHSGGTGSGHYTAYCKNPYSGDWWYYNDSRVSKASSNQVVSSEAYILFYEAVNRAGSN